MIAHLLMSLPIKDLNVKFDRGEGIQLLTYERMNYAFVGKIAPQKLKAMIVDGFSSNATENSTSWVADTGATSHITADQQKY